MVDIKDTKEKLDHRYPGIWAPMDVDLSAHEPKPIYTFIVKVATRCNIDCNYCYVYYGPDQSWRTKPKLISEITLAKIAQRIEEHVRSNKLTEIAIALHGGEPLLLGPRRFKKAIEILRSEVSCHVNFGIQTNGVLIDAEFAQLFTEEGVNVGVSLDGSRTQNDRHRHNHDGSSSYRKAIRGIELLQSKPEWRAQLSGFLAVIDIRNDPREVIEAFVDIEAKAFDILLPHMNHDEPPPRPAGEDGRAAYGKWLAKLFDIWYREHPGISISMFDDLLALALGGRSYSEALAATCVDLIIIETDGSIEAVDTLKMVGDFATSLEMNVFENSFDEATEVVRLI